MNLIITCITAFMILGMGFGGVFRQYKDFTSAFEFQSKVRFKVELSFIGGLTLIVAAALLWDIPNYPPGVNFDEVNLATDVQQLIDLRKSILSFSSFYGYPQVSYLPLALFVKFLPFSRFALRSDAVFFGILCVPSFYFFVRLLLPLNVAWISSMFFAFSPYHLFTSKIHCGAKLTFFEILFLHFFLTALHNRSRVRMTFATSCIALLLYDYLSARIMLAFWIAGLLFAWIKGQICLKDLTRHFIRSVIVLTVLLSPIMLLWTSDPDNFYFKRAGTNVINTIDNLKQSTTNAFLMFSNEKYGIDGVFTQANASVQSMPVLILISFGCLASVFFPRDWRQQYLGICMLLSLLPSILSSFEGNSHRAMMIIPLLFITSGYALWMLIDVLRYLKNQSIINLLLTAVVVYQSFWSFRHYFIDMWNIDVDRLENNWSCSEIRSNETAWNLYQEKTVVKLSRPSNYMKAFSRNSPIPLNTLCFSPKRWLPENWDARPHAIILTEFIDEPILEIMQKNANIYRFSEKYYPIGKTRLIIGRSTLPDRVATGSADAMGSIMFAREVEAALTGRPENARLFIDGVEWAGIGMCASFAEGLHEVQMARIPDLDSEVAESESGFQLEIFDRWSAAREIIELTPSILYNIPVKGWVHRAWSPKDPDNIMFFAVEPFIFFNNIFEKVNPGVDNFSSEIFIHEWKSRIAVKLEDPVPLIISIDRGELEVLLNGRQIGSVQGKTQIAFSLDESHLGADLVIRWKKPDQTMSIRLLTNYKNQSVKCPPYEMFEPRPEERHQIISNAIVSNLERSAEP